LTVKAELIANPKQVTSDWLNDVLAASGIQATARRVDVQPVTTGYFGNSCRLVPSYRFRDAETPESFFLKMATEHEAARQTAAQQAMYRNEIRFYQQLAHRVNISTPHCYYADISDDDSMYVLLLEDLAPLKQVDQLQGCNLSQSRLAVQEVAGLHASTWRGKGSTRQGKAIDACDWVQVPLALASSFAEAMTACVPAFLERYGAGVPASHVELLHRILDKEQAYWNYVLGCNNRAYTHGDYRADNLLFGERNGSQAMAAVDWNGKLLGSGIDLAHFLGTSLRPTLRKKHEIELLRHYHRTLVAQGVSDFSLTECIQDYYRSLVYPINVVLFATASVKENDRGHQLFTLMFNNACRAIRETDALDLIESL